MAPEIRKILFASDLSEHARYAFGHAALIAAYSRARIIILHVMEELAPGAEERVADAFGKELYKELKTRKKDGARDILIHKKTEAPKIREYLASICKEPVAAADLLQSDVIEDILVVEGNVAEEIISAATEHACDVLVMGSRQRSLLSEAFSGSVVRKVLRRSTKPVFVVPLPE
jgi:nucleotide-binding universal stress UspA family protein